MGPEYTFEIKNKTLNSTKIVHSICISSVHKLKKVQTTALTVSNAASGPGLLAKHEMLSPVSPKKLHPFQYDTRDTHRSGDSFFVRCCPTYKISLLT